MRNKLLIPVIILAIILLLPFYFLYNKTIDYKVFEFTDSYGVEVEIKCPAGENISEKSAREIYDIYYNGTQTIGRKFGEKAAIEMRSSKENDTIPNLGALELMALEEQRLLISDISEKYMCNVYERRKGKTN